MIDIHSHILWEIDDGAKKLNISIEMAKLAVDNNITSIIATPHFKSSSETLLDPQVVIEKVEELNKKLKEENIKLKVYTGMEIYAANDILELLEQKKALTLANSRYILLEFSAIEIPYFLENLVQNLILTGYIPIIAHPERNIVIGKDINILKRLIDMGAYTQVNKGSLIGKSRKETKKLAIRLIKEGLVHCIGTDMHNTNTRSPRLDGLIKKLRKYYTNEQINIIINENPNSIINNSEELVVLNKKDIKQKTKMKWWKKLIIALSVTILLGVGAAYYIINKSFDMIMKNMEFIETQIDYDLLAELQKIDTDLLKQETNSNDTNYSDTSDTELNEDNNTEDIDLKDTKTIKNGENTKTEESIINEDKTVNQEKTTEIEEQNKTNTQNNQKQQNNNLESDAKEIIQNQVDLDKITTRDKAKAIGIVYGGLSTKQINELMNLTTDGISSEDINTAKEVLKNSLSEDDIEELRNLYRKYMNQ